jgi:hypothetical protein
MNKLELRAIVHACTISAIGRNITDDPNRMACLMVIVPQAKCNIKQNYEKWIKPALQYALGVHSDN